MPSVSVWGVITSFGSTMSITEETEHNGLCKNAYRLKTMVCVRTPRD